MFGDGFLTGLSKKQEELHARIVRGRALQRAEAPTEAEATKETDSVEATEKESESTMGTGEPAPAVSIASLGNKEEEPEVESVDLNMDAGVPTFSSESPIEKAFAAASKLLDTDLAPEDDPNHPNFKDPLDSEPLEDYLCKLCQKPEDGSRLGLYLMMCYHDFDGIDYCERWFHPSCVGRKKPPQADWICQDCANRSFISKCGKQGKELELSDEEDDEQQKD